MKIKISKGTKRIIIAYLAVMLILYVVVFVIPKISDAFDTTQTLENGNLEVSCDTTGYFVKEEAVCTATETGQITYKLSTDTVVKKGSDISSIAPAENENDEAEEIAGKYEDYLQPLKKYDLLLESNLAPISGIFSTVIDGQEKYFSISNLDKIKKEKAEKRRIKQIELDRDRVVKGEPVFKISNDDVWYLVCWMEKSDAKKFELDSKVRIKLPSSTIDARVFTKNKEGELYKMVFSSNAYYEDFTKSRKVEMTVVSSNTTGLIVGNECIISKNGVEGVYVKTKDDYVYFVPVKVKISNDEQSVIYESIFVNEKCEQVETVSVYQEVLKDPREALEKDMRNDIREE